MEPYISAINVYPIKSCAGTSVGRAYLDRSGFQNDRKFMIVGPDNRFLSQRDLPRMALIRPRIEVIPGTPLYEAGELVVNAPGMSELRVLFSPKDEVGVHDATVWDDSCLVIGQGNQASAWFSGFLKTPCELVRIVEDGRVHHLSALNKAFPVNFQDSCPILIISAASLADLNDRLEKPISMDRFRPNIVVSGIAPYKEDKWLGRIVRIGRVEMRGVKLCQRCPTTTVDQRTGACGENPWDEEPLRTLLTYRQVGGGVIFGINCVHDNTDFINLGDSVEIFS